MLAHVLSDLIECYRKQWLQRLLLTSTPLSKWMERNTMTTTTRHNSPSGNGADRLDLWETRTDQNGGSIMDRNSRVASWILSQTDARYDWIIYDKLIWVCSRPFFSSSFFFACFYNFMRVGSLIWRFIKQPVGQPALPFGGVGIKLLGDLLQLTASLDHH